LFEDSGRGLFDDDDDLFHSHGQTGALFDADESEPTIVEGAVALPKPVMPSVSTY